MIKSDTSQSNDSNDKVIRLQSSNSKIFLFTYIYLLKPSLSGIIHLLFNSSKLRQTDYKKGKWFVFSDVVAKVERLSLMFLIRKAAEYHWPLVHRHSFIDDSRHTVRVIHFHRVRDTPRVIHSVMVSQRLRDTQRVGVIYRPIESLNSQIHTQSHSVRQSHSECQSQGDTKRKRNHFPFGMSYYKSLQWSQIYLCFLIVRSHGQCHTFSSSIFNPNPWIIKKV